MIGNVCQHCAAVGRLDPHKQGSGYFDPKIPSAESYAWLLELYLNNIAAAATQAVANGGSLAELSAVL